MKNKGITLVALVITIVVLLILAGISISGLMNQGLFSRAKDAETKSEMADAKETIILAINEWYMDNATEGVNIEDFFNQKVVNSEIDGFEQGDDDQKYYIYKDEYVLVIDSKGNIVEDIQKAGPMPKTENIKITTDGTNEVADNSVKRGTVLNINFDSRMEGGIIKSVTPEVPYVSNGKETNVKFTIIGTVDGIDYIKTLTINLEKKYKSSILSAKDISDNPDKTYVYGAKVTGYTNKNDSTNGWQVFFADENNIYLIADNYVGRDYLPASTKNGVSTTNKLNPGSYSMSAYFTNIIKDYEGSSSITDTKIKMLNKNYFNDNNFTSTNNNMKAVAYMLDTKAWENFKDKEGNAEYAIGVPTIEILLKSYSQKYNVNYQAKAIDSVGYKVSNNNGSTLNYYIDNMFNLKDSQYIINSLSKARGMWVASPSNYNSNCVFNVNYVGLMNYNNYGNSDIGFRPLICLKSDVKLRETADGYVIQK